jgi:hypothetical protein
MAVEANKKAAPQAGGGFFIKRLLARVFRHEV